MITTERILYPPATFLDGLKERWPHNAEAIDNATIHVWNVYRVFNGRIEGWFILYNTETYWARDTGARGIQQSYYDSDEKTAVRLLANILFDA